MAVGLEESAKKILEKHHLSKKDKDAFLKLYKLFLAAPKTKPRNLNTVTTDQIDNIATLASVTPEETKKLAKKLAVIKLNGGIASTMKAKVPKSTILVKNNLSFLDISIRQIADIKKNIGVSIPFFLMNSFYTHRRILKELKNQPIKVKCLKQSRCPIIDAKTSLPFESSDNIKLKYYPPGHGEIFDKILNKKFLSKLLSNNIEVLFISNCDNLGASLDFKILKWIQKKNIDFLMEVSDQTPQDVKGGIIHRDGDRLYLAETSQIKHLADGILKNRSKKIAFNTNNIWINIACLIDLLNKQKKLELPLIINQKTEPINFIQLETAVGSAISFFKNASLLAVERDRFLPVKTLADLFLIQSDIFILKENKLELNSLRKHKELPIIDLGGFFDSLKKYQSRIKAMPSLLDLQQLTVRGDVTFAEGVTLKGKVKIVAGRKRMLIAPGTKLEDQVFYG